MDNTQAGASDDGGSPTEIINLTIRGIDGRQAILQVPHDINVADLCELVAEQFSETPERARLIYRGRGLSPSDPLSNYINTSGTTEATPHSLHVVFRPPPATQTTSSAEAAAAAAPRPIITPPGVFMGSLRIEHGPNVLNSGTPQFSISAELPNTAHATTSVSGPAFLQSFMSSLAAGLPRYPPSQTGSRTSETQTSHTVTVSNTTGMPSTDPLDAALEQHMREVEQHTSLPSEHATAHARAVSEALAQHEATVAEAEETIDNIDTEEQNAEDVSVINEAGNTTVPAPSASSPGDDRGQQQRTPPSTQSATASTTTGRTDGVRPQQVRVTVGSLPVALGPTGLGQLFNSMLGQLAPSLQSDVLVNNGSVGGHSNHIFNLSQNEQPLSQRRVSGTRSEVQRGIDSVGNDSHLHVILPQDSVDRGLQVSRNSTSSPLPLGFARFLRDMVTILGTSRRGVARASETILQTLEEGLTSSPGPTNSDIEPQSVSRVASNRSGTSSSRIPSGRANGSVINEESNSGISSRRRTESVWIPNESISDRLPWDALNQLCEVVTSASGWQLPPIACPIGNGQHPPLALFLLKYQQLTNIGSAMLSQVEAWQTGIGRLGVADVGYCVEYLAVSSQIQASLAALMSWLFLNLSRHVDQTALHTRMGWGQASSSRSQIRRRRRHGHTSTHRSSRHAPVTSSSDSEQESISNNIPCIITQDPLNNEVVTSSVSQTCQLIPVQDDGGPSNISTTRKRGTTDESDNGLELIIDDTAAKKLKTDDDMSCLHNTHDLSSLISSNIHQVSDINNNTDCLVAPIQGGESTSFTRNSGVSGLPEVVRHRYERWISNPLSFSRAVISQARQRVFSNAYASGTLNASSTSSGIQHDTCAVGPLFGLSWRHACSRVNVPSEFIEPPPEHLSASYIAVVLRDISIMVKDNLDFQTNPERFPHLQELVHIMEELKSQEENNGPDNL